MSAKKSKSNTPALPFPYRITESDNVAITTIHGSVTKFLNECVAKEVRKIDKLKMAGVKSKITKT